MTYIQPRRIDPWQVKIPNPYFIDVKPDPIVVSPFKPKRAGKDTSHVLFLLDDSASMQSCRDATIEGFNEFLQGQKSSEIKTFVTLLKFDGYSVKTVYDYVPVSKVQPLNEESYSPRGMTNLYDGIGKAMNVVNRRLKAVKKKLRDSVTVVILTDGAENASKEFTAPLIKEMVQAAETKDWTFMFLGANIDAFTTGGNLGFGINNTLQYDTKNMNATFASATRMTNDLKSAKHMGVATSDAYVSAGFTDEERKKSN
jgi:uncharacterized protein YegL